MGLNIKCPNCEKKLAEETDLTIHIKTPKLQVFFCGRHYMSVFCTNRTNGKICGFTGTYDAVGKIWVTSWSKRVTV